MKEETPELREGRRVCDSDTKKTKTRVEKRGAILYSTDSSPSIEYEEIMGDNLSHNFCDIVDCRRRVNVCH